MSSYPRLRFALATLIAGAAMALSGLHAAPAHAGPPATQTYFICPSVSLNNPNGMWVVGQHGGYYVHVPTKGGANAGSKVYLTIPVKVFDLAQIPAGWALYNSLPSYPNFVGMAGVLQEGLDTWLGSPAGWREGDMIQVSGSGSSYTVMNLTRGGSVSISHPIPLASGVIW